MRVTHSLRIVWWGGYFEKFVWAMLTIAAYSSACSGRFNGGVQVTTGAELENTHTNVFSVFVFVQLYTGMAELTEYTIQVYNNCAHHACMKCTIQC